VTLGKVFNNVPFDLTCLTSTRCRPTTTDRI